MSQVNSYKSSYRSEIDGLRAFAVLSVVLFHAFPGSLKGGFVGVDVFFVISGFLITSHIFEQLDKAQFSFTDFFSRRIRRIFPALIAVMIASLAFGWFVLLADEYNQLGKHVAAGAAFISNFIFASEVGYFDSASEQKPMLHLWSLAVEEQFYIIWPLALWFAWKLRLNLFLVSLTVFCVSFAVNILWVKTAPTETFFWPFGRFWELLSGSLLAWMMVPKENTLALQKHKHGHGAFKKHNNVNALLSSGYAKTTASLAGLLLLVVSVSCIHEEYAFPSFWAILPIAGALLIIVAGADNSIARRLLTNRVAVWFGLISYPLYLWHWPILSYVHIVEDGDPHRNTQILAVLLSILLAWLTYKFIETPIRFGRFKEPYRSLSLLLAVVLVGLAGFLISKTDLTETKPVESIYLREGLEHRIGSSSRWYRGEDDWLFLGNNYDRTVEKLKLASQPDANDIQALHTVFEQLSDSASQSDTSVVLLISPNKSTIYSEFLPAEINVSKRRYVSFFVESLTDIDHVSIHDPTENLLAQKDAEGLLYYRTDTHWNSKGAFIAFKSLLINLGLPVPDVEFTQEPSSIGDLVGIAELENFPIKDGDAWNFTIHHDYQLQRKKVENVAVSETFGEREVVNNSNPLIDMTIWVVGDSFTKALKPYLEATFKEVHYLGHWNKRLQNLPVDLLNSDKKPDLILINRVERSF